MGILVRQTKMGRLKQPIIKIGIAVTASAVMSAGAVSLFASPSPVATMPFVATAAIDTSNTTVGFADSDQYGMTPADVDRTLDEMQAMGVQNVRILVPWAGIAVVDDFYYWDTVDYLVNAAYERDMGVLGVLNSTPGLGRRTGPGARRQSACVERGVRRIRRRRCGAIRGQDLGIRSVE